MGQKYCIWDSYITYKVNSIDDFESYIFKIVHNNKYSYIVIDQLDIANFKSLFNLKNILWIIIFDFVDEYDYDIYCIKNRNFKCLSLMLTSQ